MVRYTIVFALLLFAITTIPFWLSFAIPNEIIYINAGFISFFAIVWISIAFNAIVNLQRCQLAPIPSLKALECSRTRKFIHTVVTPCYLDPIEVLFENLGILFKASLSSIKHN